MSKQALSTWSRANWTVVPYPKPDLTAKNLWNSMACRDTGPNQEGVALNRTRNRVLTPESHEVKFVP